MSTQNEADLRTVVGLLNGQLVATRKVLERLKAEPAGADHEREARMIAQIESALAVRAEPVAPAPPPLPPDRFPLVLDRQSKAKPPPGGLWIPWALAEEAYAVYASRYGRQQSLARHAERGGFHVGEMDEFLPGWRDRVDPLKLALEEVARLDERCAAVSRKLTAEMSARANEAVAAEAREHTLAENKRTLEERIAAAISLLAHTGQDACDGDHVNVVAILRGEPVKHVPERTVADHRQERADEQAWRASVDKSLRILARAGSLTRVEQESILERHEAKP